MEDSVKIPLSDGSFALVSESDAPIVSGRRWSPSRSKQHCYATTKIAGKTVYMHRLVLGAADGQYVDHENGDGLDNRRANINICTQSQNMGAARYSRVSSTTGIRGIHKHGRKWRVVAGRDERGLTRYVGSFPTLEEAVAARAAAAVERWGGFARNG